MIISREVRGAHLITAVDHPESFWADVELAADARRRLTAAADAPMVVDWSAEPIRFPRGATFSSYGAFGGVVNDPAAFTRMNLA